MLGWEFPPVFTGGLGIACYNIVKSLRSHADIHLIIPYADAAEDESNLQITGANRLGPEAASEKLTEDEYAYLVQSLYRVPVRLSPYPGSGLFLTGSHDELVSSSPEYYTLADISNQYFQTRDLYGWDVMTRTHLFAKIVERVAARNNFDVIHAHDWPTFEAAIAARATSGKPVVLHVHALETDRSGSDTRNDIYDLEKWAMQEADRIIAVSQYTKNQIMSRYGIPEGKIRVALNGAETMTPSTFKKDPDEKWITFVGRLTSQKGPQFLLEMAEKLVRVRPEVRFVVAGSGHLMPFMINEVARKRLGKHFIFTGFLSRDKIYDLLATSDAYFMPSVSEPFGLSAIEAAYHGTASVISSHSGAAEVLGNALRADFWDTDKFANYLHALLTYPALKKTITLQTQEDIKGLTWDRTADSVLTVYNEITS